MLIGYYVTTWALVAVAILVIIPMLVLWERHGRKSIPAQIGLSGLAFGLIGFAQMFKWLRSPASINGDKMIPMETYLPWFIVTGVLVLTSLVVVMWPALKALREEPEIED